MTPPCRPRVRQGTVRRTLLRAAVAVPILLLAAATLRGPGNQDAHRDGPSAAAQQLANRNCARRGLSVAIYQGRPYHSEVFATFIAHAAACRHALTIYYDAAGDTGSSAGLYATLFPGAFRLRPPAAFLAEQARYDAVLFTTPDDIPDKKLQERNKQRFLYAVHVNIHKRFVFPWQKLRVHMSPLVGRPAMVPVYDGGPPVPASGRRREVVMCGAVLSRVNGGSDLNHDVRALTRLADLLSYYAPGLKFVLYTRRWRSDHPPPASWEIRFNRSTEEVFDAVRHAAFLVIWPARHSWHLKDRLTGSLPLALSAGTPLLTSRAFADIYGLHEGRGALVSGSVDEAVAALAPRSSAGAGMTQARHQALIDGARSYRDELRAAAHRTFDSVLARVPARKRPSKHKSA